MRRLFTFATLCAAFLLIAGVAAAVPRQKVGDGRHQVRSGDAQGPSAEGLAAKTQFAPLGTRLAAATASVSGYLHDSYGNPSGSATIGCDSWSEGGQRWYFYRATTDSDGHFEVNNVLPAADGRLLAFPDEDTTFVRVDSWPNGSSYSRDLYPGRVSVTAHRGGRWGDFSKLTVDLTGSDRLSTSSIKTNDLSSTPVTGLIDVLDGSYSGGCAYFLRDEGIEFYDSIDVTSGSTSSTAITVDEAAAQRVWFTTPYWYSGKPGATVRIAREGFPVGWINLVTGYADDPDGTAAKTFGTRTSTSTGTEFMSVKVPAKATPGYEYRVGFQHVDASGDDYPLYLEEIYQVCTLEPSKSSITKGAKIRVTGIVPTEGHWGSQAGLKKVVTLYSHKGAASVPTKWDPTSQGWVKVASASTNGLGAYMTPYFKPSKTLTLVARYPGDNWYYGAYTSAQKITVR
jgi:hypothetical protein